MRITLALLALLALLATSAPAQWTLQQTNTTASLRGIHAVTPEIAWASGTSGTVLHTTDGGAHWLPCATPPAAEHLDFRGIQAFDAQTAIVMSSGKGDLSRLYKTTDACQNWTLVFTNPDKEGFWDAVVAHTTQAGAADICEIGSKVIVGSIFGDPAIHKSNQYDTTQLVSFYLADFEIGMSCSSDKLSRSASSIFAGPSETAFAASNSVLQQLGPGTHWLANNRKLIQYNTGFSSPSHYETQAFCEIHFPASGQSASAGIFSFAVRADTIQPLKTAKLSSGRFCQKADTVAVGGDYKAVDERQNTAAYTGGSDKFQAARTMPGGYRSSVAYNPAQKSWITVGPNGTDLSTDDGRNWHPLRPAPTDAPDADKNWNALSLPFVVGPNGRIGRLEPNNRH